MNFDKLFAIVTTIAVACAATGSTNKLRNLIWNGSLQILRESRSSNWGSPQLLRQKKNEYEIRANR